MFTEGIPLDIDALLCRRRKSCLTLSSLSVNNPFDQGSEVISFTVDRISDGALVDNPSVEQAGIGLAHKIDALLHQNRATNPTVSICKRMDTKKFGMKFSNCPKP